MPPFSTKFWTVSIKTANPWMSPYNPVLGRSQHLQMILLLMMVIPGYKGPTSSRSEFVELPSWVPLQSSVTEQWLREPQEEPRGVPIFFLGLVNRTRVDDRIESVQQF